MSLQTWQETLITAQVDGTAFANSVADTSPINSLLPPSARYTLPSNYFSAIGKTLRVKAQGRVSNIVTTPGTLRFYITLGTVATAIKVFDSTALQLNAVAKTNVTWELEATLTCRAIGSATSANLMGIGRFVSESVVGSPLTSAGGSGLLLIPPSAPAVGTGFDSTITNVVDLGVAWSVANAGNSIQLHNYMLESLN